ncbi:HrpE/YscL family type III secretion apparatus protein, partial [Chloroflexota bacterium]
MADTIESFLDKLKSEGVEQGKLEADKLRNEATQEAEKILSDAHSQAEKIITKANEQAASIMTRSNTELELAARDAMLQLRESLEKALEAVLLNEIGEQLGDSEFLKELIQSIVQRYIDADIDSYAPVKINVEPEMRQQLCDWAIGKLRMDTKEDAGGFDFKDDLRQ